MINESIDYRYADINDTDKLKDILFDCSSLLNIASIGFGSAPYLIEACKKSGICRVVFVSSTSIFTKLNAPSKSIRLAAESFIRSSDLDWTILRPTMIYGSQRDRNMSRLIKWIDKIKVLPIFGDGRSLQQPIFVRDLAWSIVEVLDDSSTFLRVLICQEKIQFHF